MKYIFHSHKILVMFLQIMPTTLQIMPPLSGIGDIAVAAPAAAAAPAATDAEPEPEPVVEEKTSFNVKLLGIDSSMKVSRLYILFCSSLLNLTKKLSNHDSLIWFKTNIS